MGRRQMKQACVARVKVREKLGMLTADQVAQLELMYARCRVEADFNQVTKVVQDYCGNQGDDRWSRLLREDFA